MATIKVRAVPEGLLTMTVFGVEGGPSGQISAVVALDMSIVTDADKLAARLNNAFLTLEQHIKITAKAR